MALKPLLLMNGRVPYWPDIYIYRLTTLSEPDLPATRVPVVWVQCFDSQFDSLT